MALAKVVDAHPALELESVWTHCAVADEPDDPFTALQLERYDAVLADLAAAGIEVPHPPRRQLGGRDRPPGQPLRPGPLRHRHLRHPPGPELVGAIDLAAGGPARHRGVVREAGRPGEGISYGLRHHLERDTLVATLPIGYADGVFRALGLERQDVLIGGRRCPMVGVVTMDQVMVDVGPGCRGPRR